VVEAVLKAVVEARARAGAKVAAEASQRRRVEMWRRRRGG
jgi:hypothetical protein